MTRRLSWIGWLPVFSVATIITAVYAAWVVAYSQLGRRPIPSMDDPVSIGGFSTSVTQIMGSVIKFSLAVWLLGMIAAIVISLLPKNEERKRWMLKAGSGFIGILLLLLLIRYSPGNACSWFLD